MIKRTLYFGNPSYLSTRDNQLVIERQPAPEEERGDYSTPGPSSSRGGEITLVPIEDIGTIMLDHPTITLTQPLLRELLSANVAVVSCDASHMPCGMFLPLASSGVQPERFKYQLRATKPLKKQLWAQTVLQKVLNQGALLGLASGEDRNDSTPQPPPLLRGGGVKMRRLAASVRTGDPDNIEGQAAAYYWANIFPPSLEFKRDRYGEPPNNLLNYGYAVLRAMTAQALVASGMLPTLGIHHRNKYNAYPLADDIMEPYRPYVDAIVLEIVRNGEDFTELSKSIKAQLLSLATVDVIMAGKRRPLHVAMQRTAASLAFCFLGERRRILYPEITPLIPPPLKEEGVRGWSA